MINLARRYTDTPFSLVCIKLNKVLDLIERLGGNGPTLKFSEPAPINPATDGGHGCHGKKASALGSMHISFSSRIPT